MAVQIGSLTFKHLTAQPFGYDATNVQKGQTYKRWAVAGLLTPAQWLDLLQVYESWRDLRILDPEPQTTDSNGDPIAIGDQLGSVVLFSCTGPGGQQFTNVECWFSQAPEGNQVGEYINASFSVVDAYEAREVELDALESDEDDLPDFGTFTINGAVLKLLGPPDSYDNLPQLALTASGHHYLSGSPVVVKTKQIQGTTDSDGWDLVRAWYEATVVQTPSVNSYYPIEIPSASAEYKVVDGQKIVQYTVNLNLAIVV
jgi:hypothetical protein